MTVNATKLPFNEQINYFKRKLNLPTDTYLDIQGKEHDYAFVVAGANRNDMLADFRSAVDKASEDGTTIQTIRTGFDKIVAKYGWDYHGGRDWRTRIIYDTNLYSSYSAGRYEQQTHMAKLRPFWQYRHRDGVKHPRPLHQSWDGLVLPYDDPFWQTHYPINAYGCHCTVVAHSAKSLEREGLTVSESPKINYVTKELGTKSDQSKIVTLPEGIDYGFDRVAGSERVDMPSKLLLDKVISVPPKLAANMVGNVLKVPEVQKLLNTEIKAMVDTVTKEKLARGVSKSVGVLPTDVVTTLTKEGLEPATAVITLRDTDVLHALRDSKDSPLPLAFWYELSEHLQNPEAVLLDHKQKHPTLLYVVSLGQGKGKVALKLDYDVKVKDEVGKRQVITTNILRTGAVVTLADIKEHFYEYKVLYGEILLD